MKKLQIGLALLLSGLFTAANAADSCPGVFLENGVGSPPVVTGQVVQYGVWGPSPSFMVYLDNYTNFYAQDPNPNNPPGAYFYLNSVATYPVSYGSHTLRVDWDGCVLNFSNTAPTAQVDYVNVTSGSGGYAWGYWAGNWGSASPTATSNGKTYKSIADNYNPWGGIYGTAFAVCGFSSNPGTGWLVSIAVGSSTRSSSAASYSYGSGCASWAWTGSAIGIPYSGVAQVTVTHY